jgi:hypothetical protein
MKLLGNMIAINEGLMRPAIALGKPSKVATKLPRTLFWASPFKISVHLLSRSKTLTLN